MQIILFFDGICVMCNGLVDFVLKHDHHRLIKLAPLQGQTAKELIPEYCQAELNTVVLKDGQKILTESDAIIKTLTLMGGIAKLAIVLKLIPKFIRDSAYRFIAKNRYKWFGQKESCRLPTIEERKYILP